MPEKSITAFAEFREELRTAITFWIIGASGTGITVATLKHAIVRSDGTNIVRVTADT